MPYGMSDYDHGRMRNAVAKAVREGRLTRPVVCQVCDMPGTIIAHHMSYKEEDWLQVIWICRSCHYDIHQRETMTDYQYDSFARAVQLQQVIDKFKSYSAIRKRSMQTETQRKTQELVRRLLKKDS